MDIAITEEHAELAQVVRTTHAQFEDRCFAFVRTNNEVPKHKGITFMVIDMQAPVITNRPLRQITGSVEFNEVFFDEGFAPDADVVGQVDGGWSIARTALGNERVSLGGIGWKSSHWRELQDRALEGSVRSPAILHELGLLTAKWMAVEALNMRAAARATAGKSSDVRGNVTKLIATELKQRTADFGLRVLAEGGIYVDQDSRVLVTLFLFSRMHTIAGGTSEIVRDVIGERVLGLPRQLRH